MWVLTTQLKKDYSIFYAMLSKANIFRKKILAENVTLLYNACMRKCDREVVDEKRVNFVFHKCNPYNPK